MSEAMLYEDYIRQQIERGSCGVAIIPATIAEGIAEWIEKQRDRTDVVRCKDCQFWERGHSYCPDMMKRTEKNGYCAWGAKRENETD